MPASIIIRPLVMLAEFEQVIALENRVWGYADASESMPLTLLIATVRRGAILVGAFDGPALVGAVYSLPALKDGRPVQWSHMLAVDERYRGLGVGRLLKIEQRRVALEQELDLVEWTADPLQAANAHLNFCRLGAYADHYEANVYGQSTTPLWTGIDSDRLVVEWPIASAHVARRLRDEGLGTMRAAEVADAFIVVEPRVDGPYPVPSRPVLDGEKRRLSVRIPLDFARIQRQAPAVAREWQRVLREVFTTYLPRGYRVIDFISSRTTDSGAYLLARRTRPK